MSRTGATIISEKKKLSVFLSYSHADESYLKELDSHLAFLKLSGLIDTWYDHQIKAGEPLDKPIHDRLECADIILLLVSPDFANSEYCWYTETALALERSKQGLALVVPIMIRPVEGWKETPIGKLKALLKDGKAVTSKFWRNHDDAYHDAAKGLRDLINRWPTETVNSTEQWTQWSLKVDGHLSEYTNDRINSIAIQLRKAANSLELRFVEKSEGSVALQFQSPQSVLETLQRLYANGQLQQKINNVKILRLDDLGAVLRVESRIVDDAYQPPIRYLPIRHGNRAPDEGFPPLVGGISFPLNNPMQIGFSLLCDPSSRPLTPDEQNELQGRLWRYLNTF